MKIETLIDRINNAESLISRKQNTISKKITLIEKKKSKIATLNQFSDEVKWLKYDIEALEDDIKRLNIEIEDKKISLKSYKESYQKEIEKANSRNVEPILRFLTKWKQKVKEYYVSSFENWINTLYKMQEESKKYSEWYNNGGFKASKNEDIAMKSAYNNAKKAHNAWNFIDRYANYRYENGKKQYFINLELLQKDLDYEANCKYDFIIEKVNNITGQIIDATNLSIGNKGDLNGAIIGVKGKAYVQTIGAGGYNIQCYHFRTLINKI